MPIVNKAADYYLTYRFIKTLVTPFVDTKVPMGLEEVSEKISEENERFKNFRRKKSIWLL